MSKREHGESPVHPPYDEYEDAHRRASAEWFVAASVAERLGVVPSEATALQRAGELLAVWLPSDHRFLHPTWQLDEQVNPAAEVVAILTLPRSPNGMDIGIPSSGLAEVEWFL